MENEPPRRDGGKGSDVHGSEHRANTSQTEKPQPTREEMDRLFANLKANPSSLRRLRFYESEVKLQQRELLENAMRVSAHSATRARSERARNRFWAINEDAHDYAMANTSEARLAAVVELLRKEFRIAAGWEALEAGSPPA